MEMLLLVVGVVLMLVGLAGAVLPLPGPPLTYIGMLAVYYSGRGEWNTSLLITFAVITALVVLLDYLVPIWGTKKWGGSKWGMIGAGIGLVLGLFLGPFGIFIGAFGGAFLLEYLHDKNTSRSFKAALGSFIGIMAGIFMKVILCVAMIIYVGIALF